MGKGVAERLGRPFLDFDVEIERRTGLSVAQIFRERGEPYFRELELELTRELAGRSGMILAPGGGWVAVPGAMALLRPPARMIYLRASPTVALLRMGQGRAARPLLQAPDPLAELERLLAERGAFYAGADHVIDVDVIDLQGVISTVSRLASTSEGGYL